MSGRNGALRLGTRASALATAQSEWVAGRLRSAGHQVSLVPISTYGDRSAAPLTQIGGTGVFASALRTALLRGEIDAVVHSLKDLPVAPEPGLVIAAVPPREDPRDVLVTRTGTGLSELAPGSVVGTGAPRRAAALRAQRPDLEVRAIRGNVDSRIGRVRDGSLDAVVLARAGLARLGLLDLVGQTLDPQVMLPAPGQGALAIECREQDIATSQVLQPLDDALTRVCVLAERSLLGRLQAGCTAPIGALAGIAGDVLELAAFVGSEDGRSHLRRTHRGPVDRAAQVGAELADRLLADGVRDIVQLPPDRLPTTGEHLPAAAPAPPRQDVLDTQLASERTL